jgi:hypothetical protein
VEGYLGGRAGCEGEGVEEGRFSWVLDVGVVVVKEDCVFARAFKAGRSVACYTFVCGHQPFPT